MEIICKGNQQRCFMDSCAHNCGCPGLKEFGEKMNKQRYIKTMLGNLNSRILSETDKEQLYNSFSRQFDQQQKELISRQNISHEKL